MRVFADYHHSALYESLRLLFEERLDWKLYKPIGTEWYANGYWKLHTHPDLLPDHYPEYYAPRRKRRATSVKRQVTSNKRQA